MPLSPRSQACAHSLLFRPVCRHDRMLPTARTCGVGEKRLCQRADSVSGLPDDRKAVQGKWGPAAKPAVQGARGTTGPVFANPILTSFF